MGCASNAKVPRMQFCCSGEQFDPTQGEDYAVNTDESQRNNSENVIIKHQSMLSDSRQSADSSLAKIKAKAAKPPSEANEAIRLSKLSQKFKTAPNLRLRVISSTALPRGTVINITALGAENSLRNASDGRTFFGCKKRGVKGNKSAPIINDVVIPAADPELTERHRGKHFQIEFDPFRDVYLIKDLGNGFGAFAKLDSQLFLRDNNLIHIGESFVVVNIVPGKDSMLAPKLRLKLFGGPSTGEVFYFTSEDMLENKIRVGRHPMCEVPIDDPLISKVQFTVQFEEDNGWVLVDGDLEHQRGSTNGTWVYLSDEYEIYNGMVFKVSSTLFHAMIWI